MSFNFGSIVVGRPIILQPVTHKQYSAIDALYTSGIRLRDILYNYMQKSFKENRGFNRDDLFNYLIECKMKRYYTKNMIVSVAKRIDKRIKEHQNKFGKLGEKWIDYFPESISFYHNGYIQIGEPYSAMSDMHDITHWKTIKIILKKYIKRDWGDELRIRRMPEMAAFPLEEPAFYYEPNIDMISLVVRQRYVDYITRTGQDHIRRIIQKKRAEVLMTTLVFYINEEEAQIPDSFKAINWNDPMYYKRLIDKYVEFKMKRKKEIKDLKRGIG
jgi:hypothetical protein